MKRVLTNHKHVQESLAVSYGYERVKHAESSPGLKKELYERMLSILYEEPQTLATLLGVAQHEEVDALVQVGCGW